MKVNTEHYKKLLRENNVSQAVKDYREETEAGLNETRYFMEDLRKEIRVEDIENRLSELEKRTGKLTREEIKEIAREMVREFLKTPIKEHENVNT
jgi:hypothetical protein